jgi:hypothetical protein
MDLSPNGSAQFESGEFKPLLTQEYTISGEVVYPADDVPQNDTITAKANLSGIAESPFDEFRLEIRRAGPGTLFFDYSAPSVGARLAVYDVSGKLVDFFFLEPGSDKSLRYDSAGLLRGIYFARLCINKRSLSRKFIVY